MQTPKTLVERFMSKVVKVDGGCWIWIASFDRKSGYGQIQRGKRGQGLAKAHRVSFEIHCGLVPKGMMVCHRCDNKKCVNPDHLFLGTAKDNTTDMISKKRGHWQENRPSLQPDFDAVAHAAATSKSPSLGES